MYYPYLRARQFELISLRELVLERAIDNKNIMPILEPVKESLNSLNLANTIFQENGFSTYLIMNPQVGELPGDNTMFLEYIKELENNQYLTAFHYSDNAAYILKAIEDYELDNCMIICLDNFTEDESLKDLAARDEVSHIVLLEPQRYRSLNIFFKNLNKSYVRLDDSFEKQERNSDYLNIPRNKFSEEHLYYDEEGYQGFADYTTLSSEYLDSGFAPRAVVIHLSYLNPEKDNEVWIGHFTSISNDSIVNVQGKFAEATEKAVAFIDALPLHNSATNELKQYFEDKKYPGLGTVKKISIKNHLLIINQFLNS